MRPSAWYAVLCACPGAASWHPPGVNPKRLFLATLAVFATIWVTDFFIHGVWMRGDYEASMSLWRPEAEMQQHMGWLMLGQLLVATAFVLLWARGFAATGCLRCACLYGLTMAFFGQAHTLVIYAVQPLPGAIAAKWFGTGLVQGVLAGLVVRAVYKPLPAAANGGKPD
jgi:hypothetical protein